MKRSTIVEIISVLMLSLFLYAAITKIMDYGLFRGQLVVSPILKPIGGFIAWSLPAVEILVVVLLIVPRWRLKGLWLSLGLLVAFIIYIMAMMAISDHLPCSCGGLLEQLSWKGHIIFNSIFALMAAVAISMEKGIKRGRKRDLISAFA